MSDGINYSDPEVQNRHRDEPNDRFDRGRRGNQEERGERSVSRDKSRGKGQEPHRPNEPKGENNDSDKDKPHQNNDKPPQNNDQTNPNDDKPLDQTNPNDDKNSNSPPGSEDQGKEPDDNRELDDQDEPNDQVDDQKKNNRPPRDDDDDSDRRSDRGDDSDRRSDRGDDSDKHSDRGDRSDDPDDRHSDRHSEVDESDCPNEINGPEDHSESDGRNDYHRPPPSGLGSSHRPGFMEKVSHQGSAFEENKELFAIFFGSALILLAVMFSVIYLMKRRHKKAGRAQIPVQSYPMPTQNIQTANFLQYYQKETQGIEFIQAAPTLESNTKKSKLKFASIGRLATQDEILDLS